MKIRTGFVSNSSSSSFIFTIENAGKVCSECGRSYDQNILTLLNKEVWLFGDDQEAEQITEMDRLVDFLYGISEEAKEKILKLLIEKKPVYQVYIERSNSERLEKFQKFHGVQILHMEEC